MPTKSPIYFEGHFSTPIRSRALSAVTLRGFAFPLAGIARSLALRPFEPVPHASSIAIRLVLAGVFFELRSKYVEHLLGSKAEARGPSDEHISQTWEIYGGYLTVAGLIIELADNTREVFDASRFAAPISTAIVKANPLCHHRRAYSIPPICIFSGSYGIFPN